MNGVKEDKDSLVVQCNLSANYLRGADSALNRGAGCIRISGGRQGIISPVYWSWWMEGSVVPRYARGHPKKIYEPPVHPDRNTPLRGFSPLNYIRGRKDETVSHRVYAWTGEGLRGGVPLPAKRFPDNLQLMTELGGSNLNFSHY